MSNSKFSESDGYQEIRTGGTAYTTIQGKENAVNKHFNTFAEKSKMPKFDEMNESQLLSEALFKKFATYLCEDATRYSTDVLVKVSSAESIFRKVILVAKQKYNTSFWTNSDTWIDPIRISLMNEVIYLFNVAFP